MFWHSFVAYTRKIVWDILKSKYFGLENCGQGILRKKICLKILSFLKYLGKKQGETKPKRKARETII